MDWYDTLLYLHVLAAFILVAANVTAWAMYVGTAGGSRPSPLVRMAPMGGLLGVVGSLGVLIFGIWLAIYVKDYEVWDGVGAGRDRAVGGRRLCRHHPGPRL